MLTGPRKIREFLDREGDSNIVTLPHRSGIVDVYLFSQEELRAIHTAFAAGRPLLVRAEPGHLKREFALAAATLLNYGFIEIDVDEAQELEGLLWNFDADQRRAEASLLGQMAIEASDWRKRLDKRHFITPGPIWWAFDPESAVMQSHVGGGQRTSLPDGPAFVLLITDTSADCPLFWAEGTSTVLTATVFPDVSIHSW